MSVPACSRVCRKQGSVCHPSATFAVWNLLDSEVVLLCRFVCRVIWRAVTEGQRSGQRLLFEVVQVKVAPCWSRTCTLSVYLLNYNLNRGGSSTVNVPAQEQSCVPVADVPTIGTHHENP